MKRALRLALVAALVATPSFARPQDFSDAMYLVKNNTTSSLSCRVRLPGQSWSAWFAIGPGQEWTATGNEQSRTPARLFCRPPVQRIVYLLSSGERYVMLRHRGSREVRLRAVTIG